VQLLMRFVSRPHPEATEVYVTGTFDDWGMTEKLNKVGNTFEKEVTLPDAGEAIFYKVRRGQALRSFLYPS
jgi:Glycogen recognition site of AMP-activated protein kinase